MHGTCFCFIFVMQFSNISYIKFELFSRVGQIVREMFSAIKYPRMFSTASLVYLLIVTNLGIFGEVRLTFRLIKLGKWSDIVPRIIPAVSNSGTTNTVTYCICGTTVCIRFVVNLVDKTTAVFCESSGKGYLGEEAICTKHINTFAYFSRSAIFDKSTLKSPTIIFVVFSFPNLLISGSNSFINVSMLVLLLLSYGGL